MPAFRKEALKEDNLQFYTFVGMILGLAVHHGMLVDVQFIPAFFRVRPYDGNQYAANAWYL